MNVFVDFLFLGKGGKALSMFVCLKSGDGGAGEAANRGTGLVALLVTGGLVLP